MRLIRVVGLISILTVAAFGQRGGFGGFRGGGFGGGFRGGFGGGFRGGFGGGFRGVIGGGFGGFRGGFVGGRFGGFGRRTFSTRFFVGGTGFFPGFVYPGYYPFGLYDGLWDGSYDYGYPPPNYGYTSQPNVTVIYLAPPPGGPQYVSQERYQPERAEPRIRDYGSATTTPTANRFVYFSLARRDGTVQNAAAFWIQDDTLHYIDMSGHGGQMPLSDIDRAVSDKLNRERGIEFSLPPG